jgi:outer membrane protein assembly factor BamB
MQYDKVFEPIVLGNTLYVGFNDRDKVAAFNAETGAERWSYYVDGPVRLPLAGWHNKIYFTSDDGFVYCLSAKKGELLWKFRGGAGNGDGRNQCARVEPTRCSHVGESMHA